MGVEDMHGKAIDGLNSGVGELIASGDVGNREKVRNVVKNAKVINLLRYAAFPKERQIIMSVNGQATQPLVDVRVNGHTITSRKGVVVDTSVIDGVKKKSSESSISTQDMQGMDQVLNDLIDIITELGPTSSSLFFDFVEANTKEEKK